MALSLASCGAATSDGIGRAPSQRAAADEIAQSHAQQRRARIGDLSYALDLDLTAGAEEYTGVVEIRFTLSGDGPLTIDFGGGTVDGVEVNGTAVAADYNGFFITVPGAALAAGQNRVRIRYRHAYSRDGTGLHRFVDPVDGRAYLYTYLWPYYANRLFPSFDQPDLKARYGLRVRAESGWHLVSTAAESAVEDDGDARLWTFPETEKISSYIFSLHAGPYTVWQSDAGGIPIRLFARQSLAPYVPFEEWFEFTRQGLEFYARYFGIPYPFGKYDQLIVPDFNIGAMENVAAVTFAERYVQRGPSTRFDSERRAGVILHEMAHMWFGDLVTKRWWNGLWLNESFATYMASLAKSEATRFRGAWHGFFLASKLSAYQADGLVTTHPIEVAVPSTTEFFSVFDAITYGKGASVLKQLTHFAGAAEFRAGVSAYLKEHAYGNADIEDFISAISAASGRDLRPWAEQWLNRAGVNRIEARYECAAGVITSFSILQTAPDDWPTLRRQRVRIGLYGAAEGEGVGTIAVLAVEIDGAETRIDAAVGKPCPDMVHPNHGDWGYARVVLDARTLATLRERLSEIGDPLMRSMFWQALWGMALNTRLALDEYLDLVLANLPRETDLRTMRQVQGSLAGALGLLERLTPEGDTMLATYAPRAEDMMWRQLLGAATADEARELWFDAFVGVARSEGALGRLAGLLDVAPPPGIEIDQDRRWAIIQRLNGRGFAGADAYLEREAAADLSDAGRQMTIAARAGRPELAVKRRWLADFLDTGSPQPLSRQRSAMRALFPSHQTALHGALLDDIVAALPALSQGRDSYFLSSYGRTLLYGVCRGESVASLARALDGRARLHPTLLRVLREAHQRDARCLALRRAMTAGG